MRRTQREQIESAMPQQADLDESCRQSWNAAIRDADSLADLLLSKPISGRVSFCPRAAAAPAISGPMSAMNSRRCMCLHQSVFRKLISNPYSCERANVGFGSFAGHSASLSECPLCALKADIRVTHRRV